MRFPLDTRYRDYDAKGHVNNAVYLTYFEMARHEVWRRRGVPGDFPFILGEATVKFTSQARLGEPLDIELTTGEIRTRAWVWKYVIRQAPDERTVAEGSTVQVMFDYETEKTIPIPPDVRAWLESLR